MLALKSVTSRFAMQTVDLTGALPLPAPTARRRPLTRRLRRVGFAPPRMGPGVPVGGRRDQTATRWRELAAE